MASKKRKNEGAFALKSGIFCRIIMLYLLAEIAVLTEFLEAFFENFRPAEVLFCLKSEQILNCYRLKFDFFTLLQRAHGE